jgi:DNA-binding winged helix-turn-helix (wHTH) protein
MGLIVPCERPRRPLWGTEMQFLFANHTLDIDRRELRRGSEPIAVEPQVFDLLIYLVENRNRVVSKDDLIASVWDGRIVSDSTLTSRINAARKAIGDSGRIRTDPHHRAQGFRSSATSARRQHRACPTHRLMQPSTPGLRQAHCTARTEFASPTPRRARPPLVKTANWPPSRIRLEVPSGARLQAIAAEYRLICYDARERLSDWEVEDLSFEAFVRDGECRRRERSRSLSIAGHVAGLRRVHRLRCAPPRAGKPLGALRRICKGKTQARIPTGDHEL